MQIGDTKIDTILVWAASDQLNHSKDLYIVWLRQILHSNSSLSQDIYSDLDVSYN